ncbi:MAG TPA: hypothetical protein PLX69_17930 [Leptospiraceae bacterium]|nr:hypothetical protein [Leptospiraceae bacterium]HRG76444.1 hypothetical protein [Leptospiraceae bacterium]
MAEPNSKNNTEKAVAPPSIPAKAGAIDKTVLVKTPQSMNSLSATSRSIMDELRDRHKGKDRPGAKALHPTELITLDKITDHLHKYTNLSEQAKSIAAIDQALKQLSDIDNGGRERMAYLYPFLIKNGAKVLAKIAMVSPQYTHEINVKNYREACFDYSRAMVDLILSNRAKRIKEIDENNPGNFLFQKNKSGASWLYPMNCSLEAEIGLLIKGGFKPYAYIPIKDFVDDFIEYGNEKGLLEQVMPGYHLIIDEIELKDDGTYQRPPEIVNHYRAQSDGLEKFAMEQLRKLAEEGNLSDIKYKLNEYKREHIDLAPDGRRQGREKVKILIEIIKSFPFDKFNSEFARSVQNTCNLSVRIVEKFMSDMNNLLDRKYSSIYNKLSKSLEKLVTENTKTELTLLSLDLNQEVERAGIKETEKIKSFTERLRKDITNTFGTYSLKDDSGKSLFYAVDQSYMASVLHKLASLSTSNPEYKKELEYAKIINQEMILQKNPKLNTNIKEDHINKLTSDINSLEQQERERIKREAFQRRFNLPVGLMVFIFLMTIFIMISFVEASLGTIFFGLLMSGIAGLAAAVYFRKKEKPSDKKAQNKASAFGNEMGFDTAMQKSIEEDSKSKEEKTSIIARAAIQYVFPKKYNTIDEKLYDINLLRTKIQSNLDDIKRAVPVLAKEGDNQKVASAVEYSLMTNSVVIAIPADIVPKGKPASVIINKEDFKSPLMRNQMSEHYRAVAEKNKYDSALVKYYTFLINTIEVEYYKFLNKKIL